MDRNSDHKISREDILSCWSEYYLDYLVEIVNSDFILKEARGDLLSLIGSKFDSRDKKFYKKPSISCDPDYITLGESVKEKNDLKKGK